MDAQKVNTIPKELPRPDAGLGSSPVVHERRPARRDGGAYSYPGAYGNTLQQLRSASTKRYERNAARRRAAAIRITSGWCTVDWDGFFRRCAERLRRAQLRPRRHSD